MDNIKEFLTKTNFFTNDEYENYSKLIDFNIQILKEKNKVLIILKLNKILPIDVYEEILNKFNSNFANSFEYYFDASITIYDEEILKDYINYFLAKNNFNSVIVENLFKRDNVILNDEKLISIYYFTKMELEELNKIKNSLSLFLKSVGFYFSDIDFILDNNRQSIDLYKEKIINDIQTQIHSASTNYELKKIQQKNDIERKKITKINDLTVEQKIAIIEGEIFSIDSLKLKNNNTMYKFGISDNTNSINIRCFCGINKRQILPLSYLKEFKLNDWIRAEIDLSLDTYNNNEISGLITKIIKIKKPDYLDRKDLESNKRIEICARTKMTSFDGLCTPEEVISKAKEFGHKAITICDRYNVQSYPEAMQASDKYKIKVNYGIEFEILDKNRPIVIKPNDHKLIDETYCVFDLETTGLFNEYEDIIEFGGVKIKNGIIIDKLQFFVKPTKPIPKHITHLTKISNEMVENGENIKDALKKIIDWFGNNTLVAHNGINFDIRFLNKKLIQNGLEPIKNTLIDTMNVSRAVNEEMHQHSLGVLSRKYKLQYDDEIAHRADFDAEVLSKVWWFMIRSLNNQGIKTILDIANYKKDSLYQRSFGDFALALAKNQEGIKDIYKLVSIAHTKTLFRNPIIFKETLNENRKNLILISSPYEGDVWDNGLNGTNEELDKSISFYDYIAVAPVSNYKHEIEKLNISSVNVKKTIKKIIDHAKKLNKKIVAISDAFYTDPWHKSAHDVYVHSKMLGGRMHRLYKPGITIDMLPDLYFRTTKEMLDEFAFLSDDNLINEIVINTPKEINNQIDENIRPIKSGLYTPKIGDVEEKLTSLVYKNAHKLYGENINKLISDRIKKELDAIISNGYAVIYWISHLLVKQSLDDGYLVGSRGSVGSSMVAYLSNISEVNPLPPHYLCKKCKYINFDVGADDGFDLEMKICPKCGNLMYGDGHNIPFETFLGFKGDKVPDIDLNFSGEYQPIAHNFIRKMFGDDHTFRAGTISTVANKTAYGYVKNYFENYGLTNDIRTAEINHLVARCVNVKRTTGQHPGGIIIVPKEYEIYDFSPFNYPADDKNMDWYTTHFAFEFLHDNLLKFDILGHDDPTSLKMLYELTNVDPKTIPFKDNDVLALFNSLSSIGISSKDFFDEAVAACGLPEFGTEFVRKMLLATKPQSFSDLIRISGLSHGTDVWLNNAESLISKSNMLLSEVIGCRDDIMTYLIQKGIEPKVAFSVMETVRKGKGIKLEHEEILKKGNVPDWYIDSCKKIKYLFPKAHATAYVIMAWRIAWYKIHYPAAYYATYFSIRSQSFDLVTIVKGKEAIEEKILDIKKRLNVGRNKVSDVKQKEKDYLPVYEVAYEMYLRGYKVKNVDLYKSLPAKFSLDNDGTIIPSFNVIDGLGDVAAQSIVNARQEKSFMSKEDLLSRTKITKTILDLMDDIGIISNLDDDDQLSLF